MVGAVCSDNQLSSNGDWRWALSPVNNLVMETRYRLYAPCRGLAEDIWEMTPSQIWLMKKSIQRCYISVLYLDGCTHIEQLAINYVCNYYSTISTWSWQTRLAITIGSISARQRHGIDVRGHPGHGRAQGTVTLREPSPLECERPSLTRPDRWRIYRPKWN